MKDTNSKLTNRRLSKAKLFALAALLAAAVLGATAGFSRVSARAPEPGPWECDNGYTEKTLAGCFGWSSTAYVNSSTAQATAAIGLMHLDGAGGLYGWYSGRFLR